MIDPHGGPMSTMRVIQVPKPNAPFELVERPIPDPPAGSVRIRVHACGICHSDSLTKSGAMPGIVYPRVPGHEVAGVIDAVGDGVTGWNEGTRVGVGWHGGYCGRCDAWRRGNFFVCVLGRITGLPYDGGHAEFMIADATAIARIPDRPSPGHPPPLPPPALTPSTSLRNS